MKDNRDLAPSLLQAAGLLLLFACAVYWGFTGQQSSLFVGAAVTLVGGGAAQGLRVSGQREREKSSAHEREVDDR